jgi:hypothetical protein
MARPTKYTVELGDQICARVAGGELLDKVCASLRVTREIVRQWRILYEDFGAKFDIAREDSSDALADRAQRLLDAAKPKDVVELGLLRERVQHLRWSAKVRNPTKYGEKPAVALLPPPQRTANEVLRGIWEDARRREREATTIDITPLRALASTVEH